jgi:MFS family permease
MPRNVWVVTVTSFLTDVSSEMIFNLLPIFLASVLGVQTSIIGLIEGIAESTSSLLKVFSGWYSDRIGTRKGLTMLGYGLSTLAKPFLYITTSWLGVLAVRFSDRVGKGIRTAPRDALIADSIAPHQRGVAFGLHRAGDTLGAVVGLAIALLVVAAAQSSAVTLERSTFQTLVVLSTIPAVLAVLVLAFGAREVKSASPSAPPRLSLRELSPSFKRFLAIVALFTLGNSSDAFLILRAQERGLSLVGTLGMLIAFNLVYALVAGPAGALSDRLGRKRLILVGWAVYSMIYLGFALAGEAWHIWALFAVYGVYHGMFDGTARALVADLVPPSRRGTAYGVYNAVIGLLALPASLLAGILWQTIGAPAPFIAGALLSLVAMLLLSRWSPVAAQAPT